MEILITNDNLIILSLKKNKLFLKFIETFHRFFIIIKIPSDYF